MMLQYNLKLYSKIRKAKLETQLQQLQRQFKATTSIIEQLKSAAENQKKVVHEKWDAHWARITQAAQDLNQLQTTWMGIEQTAINFIQVFQKGSEGYKAKIKSLKELEASMDQTMALNKHSITELTKNMKQNSKWQPNCCWSK